MAFAKAFPQWFGGTASGVTWCAWTRIQRWVDSVGLGRVTYPKGGELVGIAAARPGSCAEWRGRRKLATKRRKTALFGGQRLPIMAYRKVAFWEDRARAVAW